MSYTKTNWVTGDVVTAEKMNNIETRIDTGTTMIIHVDEDPQTLLQTLDVTWQEIYDAVSSGVLVLLLEEPTIEIDIDGVIYTDRTVLMNEVRQLMVSNYMDYDHVVTNYVVEIPSSTYGTFETHDPNGRPANQAGPK